MTPENASNMELVTEYTNLQRELDEENERWLILSEELETLEASPRPLQRRGAVN